MTTWSKTPPTEPGWYWYRSPTHIGLPMHVDGTGVAFPGEFGPAIPSPEAIEAAKDALRWYEDQTFALIGKGSDGALAALGLDEGKRARAALAKLEGRS